MRRIRLLFVLFVVVFLLPIGVSAGLYLRDGIGRDWWGADRSSAGLLPPPAETPGAVVRVFAAPTVRWRGIFAVHSWIVLKPEGAPAYTRYDVTAWGDPLRVNGFVPDGRWFGRVPEVVFAADGAEAAALIPRMQAAIDAYAWRQRGDYRAWPGPNSNTFVAAVLEAVPEAGASLPPTAIGRDWPHDGRWLRPAAGGVGLRLTLGGYVGVTLGVVEGVEVSILGAVAGIDLLRPAIKLPGIGRIGFGAREAQAAR
ncbi:DUF3750 domain-containing protein [Roseomonas sp. HF4]|uniref:DUF3750 domain-containing protein n=1 Tax=Roseomonas sp. HF4 TaxID=2562313 RepID=UPI00148556E8|nr:DUF3750 domain-containing protein [Roseomonas sp. HF4]